jgi:hypothetical protein
MALGAPTIRTADPLPMANIRQESEFLTVRHHCNSPARCLANDGFMWRPGCLGDSVKEVLHETISRYGFNGRSDGYCPSVAHKFSSRLRCD